MKHILVLFALLQLATASCQSATAETSNQTEYTRPAPNVIIGEESVHAYYQNAYFTFYYCGEITSNIDGVSITQNATVCQYDPGVWTATIFGGDYVKVWVSQGVTNVEINGEFRTFVQ